jgi:hypothetical protein
MPQVIMAGWLLIGLVRMTVLVRNGGSSFRKDYNIVF